MRLRIVLMSVVAAAVLAAGCGGGNGDGSASGRTESGSTATTTGANSGKGKENSGKETSGKEKGGNAEAKKAAGPKGKYIASGDAICETVPTRYNARLQTLTKESKSNGRPEPATAEKNLKAALPPIYLAIEEFEELSPPPGEEQTVEAIIDALEAAAKGLEKEPSAELTGPKSPFAEFQKLTTGYGFEVCKNL